MKLLNVLYIYILLILLFINKSPGIAADYLVFRNGQTEIILKDHLNHPLFRWPATLLSYPIYFEEEINLDELVLIDVGSSGQVPFQLTGYKKSAGKKSEAILHLISGLSPGGERIFRLQKGVPKDFPSPEVIRDNGNIIIYNDKYKVTLPGSHSVKSLPGPVISIASVDGADMGTSTFDAAGKTVESLESEIISQGPLFVETVIRYHFTDGSSYQASIRCIRGYDFLEIQEEMEGFSDKETAGWEIRWTNFSPTHRQAPNHPYGQPGDKPGFERYQWERVDQTMLNSHHGIMNSPGNGKIPFEIGIYGNWPAERNVTSTVFWDEKEMQSVGIFTKDIAFWDDREYSIWHSSGKLNVKFYYDENQLRWYYPVFSGRRSTALSCYPHQNDIDYMNELERMNIEKTVPRPKISQLSYNTYLQNRHSTIDLNKVKDWNLTYPEPLPLQKVIFEEKSFDSVKDLERNFFYGGYSNELAVSGPCQNSGYAPVPARSFYSSYVVAFNQLLPEMNAEERSRLSAMFLMHAYVAASEEYMPMRTMLSGHPNFLADVKPIAAYAAFLFPEHTEAANWADMFAKYVELNTRYHTRPDVTAWDTQGGRWTENLCAYVWAFIRPTVRANYLMQTYGNGKNNLTTENMAQISNWLINSLSAPYDGESLDFYKDKDGKLHQHYWGIVTKENGPRRVHPPQGAHAARRKPIGSLWMVGQSLQNYTPLLAENIRYVTSPLDEDFEMVSKKDPFAFMNPKKDFDTGTPPDYKSVKFTGYGIVLRAAVGTKDELSIHLCRIDRGPNYRWGTPAQGGCGNIYFYAAGKSYSHNGKNDSGDRRSQDTDLITNFGAYKNGYFKSVGMNELKRPLYDLTQGQFAELTASEETGYSWPEYKSRSIMLVGDDYFIIYDDVFNNNIGSRFSWFTHPLEDLPEIRPVKSRGIAFDHPKWEVYKTEHKGKESKGVWYDGMGDMMTFVSHKKGFDIVPADYGCIITNSNGNKDYIFRNDTPVDIEDSDFIFSGTAGFIRHKPNVSEWLLFHGTRIGNKDFEIKVSHTDVGISAIYSGTDEVHGQCTAPEDCEITFRWNKSWNKLPDFYLDGAKQTVIAEANGIKVSIPKGKHVWNMGKLPFPCRPVIQSTKNAKGKVELTVKPVDGAMNYRYEYSADGCKSWQIIKGHGPNKIVLSSLSGEKKGHIRVVAVNTEYESEPSIVYPVYYTREKPPHPDGLKLARTSAGLYLTWGEVLGCTGYRLYRRDKGTQRYNPVYEGRQPVYEDIRIKADAQYEYVVTAVSGNGESAYSFPVDNDPDSWLNFDPVPGEPFRRVSSRFHGKDNMENPVNIYYPQNTSDQ